MKLLPSLLLSSFAIGHLAASPYLLVTNKGDHTLSIIDPMTNKAVATVPEEGVTGHEVAASPDGRFAIVPIFGNSGVGKPGTDGQFIQIIDLDTKKIVKTIDLGKGLRPHHPVTNAKTGLIYVTTENENSITIIDPKNWTVAGSAPTEQEQSHMLAVSSDGKRGYTANVGPGTVSVIDLENKKVDKIIPIGKMTQRISILPDDSKVFTADQFDPRIAVIDTAKNEVTASIPLPDIAFGTAPTPDGKFLLAALINRGEVAVIDLTAMKVVQTIPVPRAPQEILVRPDGKVAYVSCDASAKVAAIDLSDWKVTALIDAGRAADGLAWAEIK